MSDSSASGSLTPSDSEYSYTTFEDSEDDAPVPERIPSRLPKQTSQLTSALLRLNTLQKQVAARVTHEQESDEALAARSREAEARHRLIQKKRNDIKTLQTRVEELGASIDKKRKSHIISKSRILPPPQAIPPQELVDLAFVVLRQANALPNPIVLEESTTTAVVARQEKEIAKLKSNIKSIRKDTEALRLANSNFEREVRNLRDTISKHAGIVAKIQSAADTAATEHGSRIADLEKNHQHQLEQQAKRLRAATDIMTMGSKKAQERHQETSNELNEALETAELRRLEGVALRTNHAVAIGDLKNEHDAAVSRLNHDLIASQADLERLRASKINTITAKIALERRLGEENTRFRTAERDHDKSRNQLKVIQASRDSLRSFVRRQSERITSLETRLALAESLRDTYYADKEYWAGETQTAEQKNSLLESKIDVARRLLEGMTIKHQSSIDAARRLLSIQGVVLRLTVSLLQKKRREIASHKDMINNVREAAVKQLSSIVSSMSSRIDKVSAESIANQVLIASAEAETRETNIIPWTFAITTVHGGKPPLVGCSALQQACKLHALVRQRTFDGEGLAVISAITTRIPSARSAALRDILLEIPQLFVSADVSPKSASTCMFAVGLSEVLRLLQARFLHVDSTKIRESIQHLKRHVGDSGAFAGQLRLPLSDEFYTAHGTASLLLGDLRFVAYPSDSTLLMVKGHHMAAISKELLTAEFGERATASLRCTLPGEVFFAKTRDERRWLQLNVMRTIYQRAEAGQTSALVEGKSVFDKD